MEIDYKTLGQRIKKARISKGLTQADVAKKINLSIRHISKIESGKANPSISIFINLVNILETTPDYLLFDNIIKLRVMLNKEIDEIVKDLTHKELSIMINMMKTNKEAIRELSNSSNKKTSNK